MQAQDSEKSQEVSPAPKPAALAGVDHYLSPEAQKAIRITIAEVDGAEVFFVGRVAESGLVTEVEPFAFGNQDAVPVIEQAVYPGSVVIHNHPGGRLEPSSADINIASRLGTNGVGSYIVDNAVTQVRVVVAAMKAVEVRELDVRRLEALLEADGPLAQKMARYEYRPEQLRMLRTVALAFNQNGIAVIEAGTGTGKSLAYLMPAVHWARQNREKVVISTNTINLQEQLIHKDIPFLKKHLGLNFKAALMKGRNNYLCKRRAEAHAQAPDMFSDDEGDEGEMQSLLQWANQTKEGSLSDLGFIPHFANWEKVQCDGDNCSGIKCPFYQSCFFYLSRREAALADIIVANHHLVMADLSVRAETGNYSSTAVLPVYKRLILDEAHNLEDSATRYFGITITRRALGRMLNRLVHKEKPHLGLLPFFRDSLIMQQYHHGQLDLAEAASKVDQTLIPLRGRLAQEMGNFMDNCAQGVLRELEKEKRGSRENQWRITPEREETVFWKQQLGPELKTLLQSMKEMERGLQELKDGVRNIPMKDRENLENPLGELNSIIQKLRSRINEFQSFYSVGENRCRWIEVRRGRGDQEHIVRLYSLPLEVKEDLRENLYGHCATVVMTSATLAVDKAFYFFCNQVGLGREDASADLRERVDTLLLETPFDYSRQAYVGVPVDMPEPMARDFSGHAGDFLISAIQISRGGAFVLFTSYSQLDQFYANLSPGLESLGYHCLKQGAESRQALLERFRHDHHAVLFATASFWEGVDVPGQALRLLVLVKLPFRVPSDPLVESRTELLEEQGVDAFSTYSLPLAVIRFKQGFGRLIRTRDDHGAVLVLDKRIAVKRYGQVFLNSLPQAPVQRGERFKVLESLRQFFKAKERGG